MLRFALTVTVAVVSTWSSAYAQGAPANYHRDFGYIPLSDGVRIAYVAYRPTRAANTIDALMFIIRPKIVP